MRRKFQFNINLLSLALLLILSISVLLCACNKPGKNPLDTSPCYDMTIEYKDGVMSVSQEILYTAPADLDEVILNVYANAFDINNHGIDILSAQINRKTIDFEIFGSDKTLLKLPYPISCGQVYNIAISYNVKVSAGNTRLGINSDGVANLACFYPVLARYENGWRTDTYFPIGDPFYHDISSFYVNLTVDEEAVVATSGQIFDTRLFNKNGAPKKTVEIGAEHIRDFAMAVGKLSVLSDVTGSGAHAVELNYYYFEDAAPAKTMERIKRTMEVFSEAFGEYPYNTFTVSQSTDSGGMEYGTFVTVSRTPSTEEYLDIITHEIAHQWWYNIVGNDQINNAWLDEGLAEFCTYYFYYLTDDRAAYSAAMANMTLSYSSFSSYENLGFNGKMNRPLSSFLTDGEYAAVVYFKGALLFDSLHTLVGENKFLSALRRYIANNAYGIATEADLIAAFKTTGYDITGIVNSWTQDLIKI